MRERARNEGAYGENRVLLASLHGVLHGSKSVAFSLWEFGIFHCYS